MAHIDFTADLADGGDVAAVELFGNLGDGADIGGDVLAFEAVAAGRAIDQHTALVAQRTGQPVDLRLGREGERLIVGKAQEPPDALGEVHHFLVLEHVAQREHRHRVTNLGELDGGGGADPAARRVRPDQVRKARLDRHIAPPQRIIFGVRHRRRVFLVIAPIMSGDLGGQPLELGLGLRFGKGVGSNAGMVFGGHRIRRLNSAVGAGMTLRSYLV